MWVSTDRIVSVTRDLLSYLGGLAGIAYQQVTGNVNVPLLAVYAAMTGIPGLVQLISLARGHVTESASSRFPSPPPESPSRSASR